MIASKWGVLGLQIKQRISVIVITLIEWCGRQPLIDVYYLHLLIQN